MAKLFGSNGVLWGLLLSYEEEIAHPIPGGMTVVEFDKDTNVEVVTALRNHWSEFDFVGGVLRRNGVIVTIAPDGAAEIERKAALSDALNVSAAQVINILSDIAARQAQITTERNAVATDIAALASATTLAQVRPIVGRILAREDNALNAENRVLGVIDRLVRAIRRLV